MEYERLLNSVISNLEEEVERVAKGLTSFRVSRGCEHYTKGCRESLIDYVENGNSCGRSCEYCEKFRWAIDRAKQYGEKLGIPWKEVIASWEEDRKYWYMNYYQECNQPKIESEHTYVFESVEEMRAQIGTEFICPCCKGISTNPYECNSGIKVSENKVCDWKSYGLFRLNLAFLYCKQERKGTACFMPKALIQKELEEAKQILLDTFPGSFINRNNEFVANKKGNPYFRLEDCFTTEDLKCKVLEWLSRAASKGIPYHQEWRNVKYRKQMLDSMNCYLKTNFSEDDMEKIYTYLGNGVNHEKTKRFVQSGYDMNLLSKK